MAFIRGGNATLTLVRFTPTTQALTAALNNVSLSFDSGQTEVTSLGDTSRDFQGTILKGTITASGYFDDTSLGNTSGLDFFLQEALDNDRLLNWQIVLGTGTVRTYNNTGYSTVSPSTTNGCRISAYEQSNDSGGIAAFSVTFQIHGAWTVA